MSALLATMRLREAVERGDGDAVQKELDAGVPVDAAGRTRWTPLHRAVDRGHVHIVRILCAASANPNVRTESGGDTPLHIAATKGDTASVSELLDEAYVLYKAGGPIDIFGCAEARFMYHEME